MATLWQRIQAVAMFRNVRILYKLPLFTRRQRQCPVCGSRRKAFEYRNRYFPIDRCLDCGHVYARVLPGVRILHLIYCNYQYWIEDKVHQGIHSMRAGDEWQGFIEARMGILRRSGVLPDDAVKRRVFEVGCSEGMILHELEQRGHEAAGCEMNKAIANAAIEELGVTIYTEQFEDLPLDPHSYDIAMAFHTLEHVRDPAVVINKMAEILKADGAVVIEVPCGPEEYDNTDHTQFFSDESLKLLLETFFERADIIPNYYFNQAGTKIGSVYGIGWSPLDAPKSCAPKEQQESAHPVAQ